MFNLLDCVRLKNERLDLGIKASFEGVIVDVINKGEAYTVEFFDENGDAIEDALMVEFKANELVLLQNFKNTLQ